MQYIQTSVFPPPPLPNSLYPPPQIHSSSLQKRAGPPRIATGQSMTRCNKTEYKPSHHSWIRKNGRRKRVSNAAKRFRDSPTPSVWSLTRTASSQPQHEQLLVFWDRQPVSTVSQSNKYPLVTAHYLLGLFLWNLLINTLSLFWVYLPLPFSHVPSVHKYACTATNVCS